jgi:hypothetical protein
MGVFSELFAEELEDHDDPPLLTFKVDETLLIVSLLVPTNALF